LCAGLAMLAVLPGCFGGGDDENVQRVLNQTFGGDKKVNSGRIRVDMTARLEGLPGTVRIQLGGPFTELERSIADTGKIPEAQLDMKVSGGGQSFDAGAVSSGTKAYVKFRGENYVLPQRTFNQLRAQLERAQAGGNRRQPDLAALGINPERWLEDPKHEGTDEVEGVETVHVSSGVNVKALLDDLDKLLGRASELNLNRSQQQQIPREIPPSVKNSIVDSVKEAHLDFFTGESDKVLRKLEARVEFALPEGLQGQAGGVEGGKVDLTYELTEVNKPQTVKVPESARPLRDLQRLVQSGGLGSLGGSAGGGGGSGGSSRGSGGFFESPQGGGGQGTDLGTGGEQPRIPRRKAERYLRCIEDAGLSRRKLRACAELLR
jgi:hypothetical protein